MLQKSEDLVFVDKVMRSYREERLRMLDKMEPDSREARFLRKTLWPIKNLIRRQCPVKVCRGRVFLQEDALDNGKDVKVDKCLACGGHFIGDKQINE